MSQSQAQEQAIKKQAPEETFEDRQEMAQKIETLMHAESENHEQPEECSQAFLNEFTRFDMPPLQERPPSVTNNDEPPPLECKVIEVSDGCCGGGGMVVVEDDDDTQQGGTESLARFSKESDLRTYKVADLRDLCRLNKLSTSGLRRDLVKRVLQAGADARQ